MHLDQAQQPERHSLKPIFNKICSAQQRLFVSYTLNTRHTEEATELNAVASFRCYSVTPCMTAAIRTASWQASSEMPSPTRLAS